MEEIPSVAQNLLQQKYGKKKDPPPPKEDFLMAGEKGVISRDLEKSKLESEMHSTRGRPSVILDLSPEAKKILKEGKKT